MARSSMLSAALRPLFPLHRADPVNSLTIQTPFLCSTPFAIRSSFLRLKRRAVADMASAGEVDAGILLKDAPRRERVVADYNWEEEWYPLYLTKDVPEDAPLGLTVFDRQLVLYKDAHGVFRCYQDRCPHRLAKLSEGQLMDGRLECLYHGWQFEGEGKCVKIPQLPADKKIPQSVCVKTYEVKESQGVIWVWMSHKKPPNPQKLPWFKNFARSEFQDTSTIHELPYDHSILLENLMDPAHIPHLS